MYMEMQVKQYERRMKHGKRYKVLSCQRYRYINSHSKFLQTPDNIQAQDGELAKVTHCLDWKQRHFSLKNSPTPFKQKRVCG